MPTFLGVKQVVHLGIMQPQVKVLARGVQRWWRAFLAGERLDRSI
jgi:hypothetical protein